MTKIQCFKAKQLLFRPTGNLLATTRLLNGKRSVWFFERNGQYRSNFDLPGENPAENEPKWLGWNMESTILALWMRVGNSDQGR